MVRNNSRCKFFKVVLFIWFLLFFEGFLSIALSAEDILIVRPLTNTKVELDNPDYEFEVEVSAFTLIQEIKINGEIQSFESGLDWVFLIKKLVLEEGKNPILVEVRTEAGEASRSFNLFYDPEGIGYARLDAKREFTLLGIFGGQYGTNPARVSGGSAGLKAIGILLPRYKYPLDDTTLLQVDGLLYRDLHFSSELEPFDASITEVKVTRIKMLNDTDNWKIGGGYSFGATQFDNPIQYEFDQQSDLFLFGGLHKALDESSSYDFGGEFRRVDIKSGGESTILKVIGKLSLPFGNYLGEYDALLENESGDRGDINTLEGGALFKAPLSLFLSESKAAKKWNVGAGLRLRIRSFSEGGDKRVILRLSGKRPISKKMIFTGKVEYQNESSDVSDGYNNITITALIATPLF